jgi:phosphopantothenoylcysteine synthetase/decarboxylase
MKKKTTSGTTPEIVLGVTGSIAAYKAAELVRLMIKNGWNVTVIMTKGATQFVGPITFQTLSRRPVIVDMFAEPEAWTPEHISVADRADVMVIAPCTANVIAKLAHGMADDMLSAVALANTAPLIVAPAMNVNMWDHPATQANVATLKSRGVTLVDVGVGDLACGYEGRGRMAEHGQILTCVSEALKQSRVS